MTYDETPYWLIDLPRGTRIIPWSGEIDTSTIEETPIETMPPDPFGPGDGLPPADTPFVFQGTGAQAAWSDVYDAAQKDYLADPTIAGVKQPDAGYAFTVHIGQVAIRSMLRAASGFINRAYDDATQNTNLLSTITDAEIGDLVGRINRIVHVVKQMANVVNGLTQYAIPGLQSQIDAVWADLVNRIKFTAAYERAWVIDNVATPLLIELGKVQPKIDTAVAHEHVESQAYTDAAVAALGVNVLRGIAPLIQTVNALKTESETCTKPMCETMGPGTNLGNFLKGLSLLADAALFAELANLDEQRLADLLAAIGQRAAALASEFESGFVQGGETLGGLVTNAIANAI